MVEDIGQEQRMSRRRSVRVIDASTRLAFYVYAQALHEFSAPREADYEWLTAGAANWGSRMYPILDFCAEGYPSYLFSIAASYRGAFHVCRSRSGETFIGLMLIESLINRHRKRVACLF